MEFKLSPSQIDEWSLYDYAMSKNWLKTNTVVPFRAIERYLVDIDYTLYNSNRGENPEKQYHEFFVRNFNKGDEVDEFDKWSALMDRANTINSEEN